MGSHCILGVDSHPRRARISLQCENISTEFNAEKLHVETIFNLTKLDLDSRYLIHL